jgi:phosphoglycerol transferase
LDAITFISLALLAGALAAALLAGSRHAARSPAGATPFLVMIPVGALLLVFGAVRLVHLTRGVDTASGVSSVFLGVTCLSVMLWLIRAREAGRPAMAACILPLLALGFYVYFQDQFGFFSWSSIVMHLDMGLSGADAVHDYMLETRRALLATLLVAVGFALLSACARGRRRLDVVFALLLLAVNPLTSPVLWAWEHYRNRHAQPVDLTAHYRAGPKIVSEPPVPLNLVHIILESAELTYTDAERFGDVMSPLAPYLDRGLNALGVEQIASAAWSVAGMAASTCGAPLLPFGLLGKNNFHHARVLMPGAACIGDVLKARGYNLVFLTGVEPGFAGIDKVFLGHGFDRVVDARPFAADPAQLNRWGSHDGVTLGAALRMLDSELPAKQPFALYVKLIGGHAPNGFVSPECLTRSEITEIVEPLLRAVKCSNLLTAEFLKALDRMPFAGRTLVAVQSDHLAHKSPLSSVLDGLTRRNLFFLYGPGVARQINQRNASHLDLYPTVLEALGLKLADGGAGLGRSLLSPEPTLISRLGIASLDRSIEEDVALRRLLWNAR